LRKINDLLDSGIDTEEDLSVKHALRYRVALRISAGILESGTMRKRLPLSAQTRGNAVDGATGFILPDREASVALHSAHPLCTVGAHSGQNDAHRQLLESLGDGFHERVDRWHVEMTGAKGIKPYKGSRSKSSLYRHVNSRGRY
jgi:hypothetical protein